MENKVLNEFSRYSKKHMKKYLNELMLKYKDKPDAILVLHEIWLVFNEPFKRKNKN